MNTTLGLSQQCDTARKIHNKSTITDCKLFSQSHCRELLLYLPRPPHHWYNAHCTRNIVTTQLQYSFVNYLRHIFGTMVQYGLQCRIGQTKIYGCPRASRWMDTTHSVLHCQLSRAGHVSGQSAAHRSSRSRSHFPTGCWR